LECEQGNVPEKLGAEERCRRHARHARTLANLIPVYEHLNLVEDAVAVARQSISIFLELHDWYSAAVATRNLAKLYRRIGESERSRERYSDAIELFRKGTEEEQAVATQKELDAYLYPVRIPWWAWTLIGFFGLLMVALVLFVVYVLVRF